MSISRPCQVAVSVLILHIYLACGVDRTIAQDHASTSTEQPEGNNGSKDVSGKHLRDHHSLASQTKLSFQLKGKHARQTTNGPCGRCYTSDGEKKDKILYFVHEHKAGGTTMCALAQKNRCHVTRWFNCNVIDKEFMKDTAFMGNISEQQNYALSQLNCHGFVANEYPLPDELWYGNTSRYLYFTMMRDPLLRLRSHYQEACRKAHKRQPSLDPNIDKCANIDVFWETNPDNWITRQFCGRTCSYIPRGHLGIDALNKAKTNLDKMEFVLILEMFDDAKHLLQQKVGWNYVDKHRNKAKSIVPGVDGNEERLRELTLLDGKLYEYATLKFLKALQEVEGGVEWRYQEKLDTLQKLQDSGTDEFQDKLNKFQHANGKCSNPCCYNQVLPHGHSTIKVHWSEFVQTLCGNFTPLT